MSVIPHRSHPPTPRRAALAAVLAGGLTVAAVAVAPAATAESVSDPATSFDEAAQAYLVEEYGLSQSQAAAALAQQHESLQTAEGLEASLGSRVLGTVVDEQTGALTVEVADSAAAAVVRSTGASAVVDDTAASLSAAQASLETRAAELGVTGVSVSVDVADGALVLAIPSGTLDGATRSLVGEATRSPVSVRVERTAGPVETMALYGGEDIRRSGSRCSAGFNLVSGSTYYLLTAGHCSGDGWADDGVVIGTTTASSFPGDDYKLIRVGNVSAVDPRGEVLYFSGLYDVRTAGSPPVGSTVCRTGSTTGTFCGSIQAYNATVRYAQGTVTGLVRTNVCAEPGDSGGPLYAANGVAVGVTSGGSGNCSVGGTTYYQTVTEVTSRFGLSVF